MLCFSFVVCEWYNYYGSQKLDKYYGNKKNLFELTSGLKVNFHKRLIQVFNVNDFWLGEAADVLHCKVSCVPFKYLSVPIGDNPHRLNLWKSMIDRVWDRLSNWKKQNLSLGVILFSLMLFCLLCQFTSFISIGLPHVSFLNLILYLNCFCRGVRRRGKYIELNRIKCGLVGRMEI